MGTWPKDIHNLTAFHKNRFLALVDNELCAKT